MRIAFREEAAFGCIPWEKIDQDICGQYVQMKKKIRLAHVFRRGAGNKDVHFIKFDVFVSRFLQVFNFQYLTCRFVFLLDWGRVRVITEIKTSWTFLWQQKYINIELGYRYSRDSMLECTLEDYG